MNSFAPSSSQSYFDGTVFSLVVVLTPTQDTSWYAAPSRPKNSRNSTTSPHSGVKSSPDASSATTDPDSISISMLWSKSPAPPPPDSPRGPCKPFSNNKPPPWGNNSPVPTADVLVSSVVRTALSRCRAHNCTTANRSATVPTVAGTFSPQRPLLRLDGHGYSPAVLAKIVTAGARLHSFADAAFALNLSGLSISARHVQQLTQEVGTDLARARDEQAQKRRRRELVPRVAAPPAVVAVEVDGGRLRTRAADRGCGVHEAENKEDKIACLITLTRVEHAADPQPEPPPSFVQPRRI